MKSLSFQQVDVFTAVPFKGNPVAVILDGDALSGEGMQSIAAWTNLSETTFVCAPTDQRADYRLRIFTPRRELPFAGHPTIGSAHAVLRRGFKPRTAGRLVQECGKGLVDIKIDGERLLLALPEPRFREPTKSHLAAVVDGLRVSASDVQRAAIIDVGPVWFTVQLASGDAVRALAPDMGKLAALNSIGITGVNVFGLYPAGARAPILTLKCARLRQATASLKILCAAVVTGASLHSSAGTHSESSLIRRQSGQLCWAGRPGRGRVRRRQDLARRTCRDLHRRLVEDMMLVSPVSQIHQEGMQGLAFDGRWPLLPHSGP
jgi:PhzF family phenazine biosynthesis protein